MNHGPLLLELRPRRASAFTVKLTGGPVSSSRRVEVAGGSAHGRAQHASDCTAQDTKLHGLR